MSENEDPGTSREQTIPPEALERMRVQKEQDAISVKYLRDLTANRVRPREMGEREAKRLLSLILQGRAGKLPVYSLTSLLRHQLSNELLLRMTQRADLVVQGSVASDILKQANVEGDTIALLVRQVGTHDGGILYPSTTRLVDSGRVTKKDCDMLILLSEQWGKGDNKAYSQLGKLVLGLDPKHREVFDVLLKETLDQTTARYKPKMAYSQQDRRHIRTLLQAAVLV